VIATQPKGKHMTHDAPNLYETDPRIDAEIRALETRIAQTADALGFTLCGFAVVWALCDDENLVAGGQMQLDPSDVETVEALASMITGGETVTETPPPSTPLRLT